MKRSAIALNRKEDNLILTHENYFSQEMSMEYLGSSQYKDFCGCPGMIGCEEKALALIKGEWIEEPSTPMLVGSYVHAHFGGTLDVFKAQHPEMFTKSGDLKASFKRGEDVIQRIERDELFMKYLSGKKEQIYTGELFGAKWKIMIDSLIGDQAIVDLKCMRNITDTPWVKDLGKVSWIEYWGYKSQGALYQAIFKACSGKTLNFYIAAASKEEYPNIEIFGFTNEELKDELSLIEPNIKRILAVKSGEVEPDRCGQCDWCKHNKILTAPIHFSELEY